MSMRIETIIEVLSQEAKGRILEYGKRGMFERFSTTGSSLENELSRFGLVQWDNSKVWWKITVLGEAVKNKLKLGV